jgi:hypothetical protein
MTISPPRVISALILVTITAVLATGWYAYASAPKSTRAEAQRDGSTIDRWEYLIVAGGTLTVDSASAAGGRKQKVFQAEASAVERNLDVLGEEGWELTAVAGSVNQPSFFLKRLKKR